MPLVSVICLCYNHERFVKEAIESVLRQTYEPIEIVVVDDASTDNSVNVINEVVRDHAEITFLSLSQNVGNCKAFNEGWKIARGKFIVDFATDDVMLPERIANQVRFFEANPDIGVVFTDAIYVDESGKKLREHYAYLRSKRLVTHVPEGDVYADVLQTYFICSPTMLVRREVFETLNGYDESLAYEDFDFWVRSARHFRYGFLNEKLTLVRLSLASLSRGWYKRGDRQVHSTYLVCRKALLLNRSEAENNALARRIRYEIRQCVFSENNRQAELFYDLLRETEAPGVATRSLMVLNRLRLPLSSLRRLYHRLWYS